jgi:hypothetical protein
MILVIGSLFLGIGMAALCLAQPNGGLFLKGVAAAYVLVSIAFAVSSLRKK